MPNVKEHAQALMIPAEKLDHLLWIGTQLACDPRKVESAETVRFLYGLLLEQATECQARVAAAELALHRERMAAFSDEPST